MLFEIILWDFQIYVKHKKNYENFVLHYVKLTNPQPFQTSFPATYRSIHGIKHRKDNLLQSPELPCRIS